MKCTIIHTQLGSYINHFWCKRTFSNLAGYQAQERDCEYIIQGRVASGYELRLCWLKHILRINAKSPAVKVFFAILAEGSTGRGTVFLC